MSAFTETDKGAGNVLHLYTDQDLASPYVMSVFVALTEKGLPFELHTVDLTQRAQYAPEYVAISTTRRAAARTGMSGIRIGWCWRKTRPAAAASRSSTFPKAPSRRCRRHGPACRC